EEADARRLVDQPGALGLEALELGGHVGDGKRDVVHARATAGEELPDGRVRAERREQLDARVTDDDQRRLDALLLDAVAALERRAEQRRVAGNCRIEIVNRDPDVVDGQPCHSRSRIAYTASLCHSPLTHSFSTSTASFRMPSFSSTRPDATLR